MPEIAPSDLPAATLARFGGNEAAQAAIDAVLVAARRECGWHVSPVREDDELTLDGPGGRVLFIPTGKLNVLTGVVESGAVVDPGNLDWSESGLVCKQSEACWSGRYRSIVVTVDHGFTEPEAADWRKAIIDMVSSVSRSYAAAASNDGLKRKKVDNVEYEWFDFAAAAGEVVYSVGAVLDGYHLAPLGFA